MGTPGTPRAKLLANVDIPDLGVSAGEEIVILHGRRCPQVTVGPRMVPLEDLVQFLVLVIEAIRRQDLVPLDIRVVD